MPYVLRNRVGQYYSRTQKRFTNIKGNASRWTHREDVEFYIMEHLPLISFQYYAEKVK